MVFTARASAIAQGRGEALVHECGKEHCGRDVPIMLPLLLHSRSICRRRVSTSMIRRSLLLCYHLVRRNGSESDPRGTDPFPSSLCRDACFTFYKVFGDLACGKPPVVVLHGGPGSGHDYCLPFANHWPQYSLPVILYDQIGCGASTHLQSKNGDASF